MDRIKYNFEISSEFKENYKFQVKIQFPTSERKIVVGKILDTSIDDYYPIVVQNSSDFLRCNSNIFIDWAR